MITNFRALFAGLDRGYGAYKLTGETSDKGKAKGKAITITGPVTDELWDEHLDGAKGLGIVPIMDNGKVWFAAIDVDVYDLDLVALYKLITTLKLPLVACRSKSGGAHLYMFFKEPEPAADVRVLLDYCAVMLGHPGVEVFPKQDYLASVEDVGNWLNMPYFDCERTTRYALNKSKALTPAAFVKYAEKMRTTLVDANKIIEESYDASYDGAPPCLQSLFASGFPDGSFNNGLFNCAVYAYKRWPDDAENKINEFNEKFFRGSKAEVKNIIRSMSRKEYFYQCTQPPIASVCNKAQCKKCEHGIGDGPSDPGISVDGVTKICSEPPIWIVQVNGARIQLDTEELLSQAKFGKRCVEALNFLPPVLKAGKWQKFVNTMLKDRREVEAPADAGPRGQFKHHLEQFCLTRAPANSLDELLLGKPWHDQDGRTYFRSADLFKYLEQQRYRDLTTAQVYAFLKEHNEVDKHFHHLKGRGVNCWSIPSFDEQIEDHAVQRIDEEVF